MIQINNFFSEVLLLSLLFISGVISLYSGNIIFLLVSIFFLCLHYVKDAKNIIEKYLYVLIIFLPFYSWIRVSILYMNLSFLAPVFNSLRDLIILIMFFITFFSGSIKLQKIDYVWLFFMTFWGYAFTLTVIYGYPSLGFQGIHLSVIPALTYIAIRYSNFDFNTEVIKSIFVKIAVVIALIGLVSYIFKPPFFNLIFLLSGNTIDAKDYIRLVSVFLTPNVCGSYFCIAFCITLADFISKRRLYDLIFSLIFFLCIALTLSRGSWSFALFSIFLCFFHLKLKTVFKLILAISLIWIGFSIFKDFSFNQNESMTEHIYNRMYSLFDTNNSSAYGRMSHWIFVKKILTENPFGLGIGVSTTAQLSNSAQTGAAIIDGFFAKTIVESGFIGILYCLSLVCWACNKIRYLFIYKEKNALLMLIICAGFFLQSIGSNPFDFICVSPWFWIFFALVSKEYKKGFFYEKNALDFTKSSL